MGTQGGLPRGGILKHSLKEWELGKRVERGCSKATLKGRVRKEDCPYAHFQDASVFAACCKLLSSIRGSLCRGCYYLTE